MKEESQKVLWDYMNYRDFYIKENNDLLACFYQIAVIYTISNSSFYFNRKRDLEVQWNILYDMLQILFDFNDREYFKGVYYEIVAVFLEADHIKYRECCSLAERYYRESKEEYAIKNIGLHIVCIIEKYQQSGEGSEKYIRAILQIFENRYGRNSVQFAKMWLHILGEIVCFQNIETYSSLFAQDYSFFIVYLSEYGFFFECLFAFVEHLLLDNDERYKYYFQKYEALVEKIRDNQTYLYHKVRVDYLKAKEYALRHNNEEAAELLYKTVSSYIQPEKNSFSSPFYGYVYLLAANQFYAIHEIKEMAEMAELGLELCKKEGYVDTELYYALLNFRGINYLENGHYKDAGKLFSSGVIYIKEHFGKENENYIYYINNLGRVALWEGRISDAKKYFDLLEEIQNEELLPLCKNLLRFDKYMMEQLLGDEDDEWDTKALYHSTIDSMEKSNDVQTLLRTKLIRLLDLVRKNKLVDKNEKKLFEELENIYFAKGFDKEQEYLFTYIDILNRWNHNHIIEIMVKSEKLAADLGEKIYLYRYREILISHIQILYLNKRYSEAIAYIKKGFEQSYDQIMDCGFGDIQNQLFYMRIFLSIYIKIKENHINKVDEKELEELYIKIVECKSIEKEILKILGKYESGSKDLSFDLFDLQHAHRKLAALEIRKQLMDDKCLDDGEIKELENEINRNYLIEEELENKVGSQINFRKLIQRFNIKDIALQEKAVCIEFFAYYDLNLETSVNRDLEEGKTEFKYAVFGVSKQEEKITISFLTCIVDSMLHMDDYLDLLEESPEEVDMEQHNKVRENLSKNIVAPILKYIEPYDMVYWGLDFLLQMLPIDILYMTGELMLDQKNNVYIDSIRDMHGDISIELQNVEALVLGNPKYNINCEYEQQIDSLPFSEIECEEVAEILHTEPFIGVAAGQSVFRERYKTDILHIATHGDLYADNYDMIVFKRSLLTNSYLILAGFEDWLNNRKIKEYGNGLIMADDFIFTDLSDTKLVVLSACVSSLGLTNGMQSLHGLRWTIGISGVQSSITALWEVDDFATAVLMILFYRNLNNMPVSRALQTAKQQLKNITVKDILKDDAFHRLAMKLSDKFDMYIRHRQADYRPFEDWRYWAAFVCYFE